MRALCRSRIPELAWGGLSAGRNAVCTSWGRAGDCDPELEQHFGIPRSHGWEWGCWEAVEGTAAPWHHTTGVAGCAGARRFVIWPVHSNGCQPACPDSASLSGPGSSMGLSSAPLLSLISQPRASFPAGAFGRQGCAFMAAPSSPQGRTWPLWPPGRGKQSSRGQKSILIIK